MWRHRLIKVLLGMNNMRTSDFDFDLPESFIAQNPLVPRDSSKLMSLDTEAGVLYHKKFSNLVELLNPGDVLVLNRSRVIPARILFEDRGGSRELFILNRIDEGLYNVLVRPGRAFVPGKVFNLSEELSAEVVEVLADGSRMVRFVGDNIDLSLEELGEMPLPPYIKNSSADFTQYQTVFANEKGSVAAPTAGLHFTEDLLAKLRNKGVQIEEVLLHVGRGTFLTVSSDDLSEHVMHAEFFAMSEETASRLNVAVSEKRRIIAVGTTSVRVLETIFDNGFKAATGETDIFIYPGKYKWKVVNGLITNFHLPKSTLIMLVASFLESKGLSEPTEKILELYEIAKKENYRFYSFGDAMFLF